MLRYTWCKNESETTVNPTQAKDKMHIDQLEFKAPTALVPTEKDRVQDIGKAEVIVMSSDEHHWALDFAAEEA